MTDKLTPAQKRAKTMEAKYGPDWRNQVNKKISQTFNERYTPEQRAEMARRAGRIGGQKSPTKFKPGDPRAARYGKLKKPRAETRSEKSDK